MALAIPAISVDQVLKIHNEITNRARELVEKKGRDYNRTAQLVNGDTLFNIKLAYYTGITESVCQGLLVRLSDKFARLVSLTKNPTRDLAISSERVDDTIIDTINYSIYLKIMYDLEVGREKK
jgi:hypothetical protein